MAIPSAQMYSHLCSGLKTSNLFWIKVAFYLVLVAKLIQLFGVPMMVGISGNSLMVAPLVWTHYGRSLTAHLRSIPVHHLQKLAVDSYHQSVEIVASFGALAPSAAGGFGAFIAVMLLSNLLSIDSILVTTLLVVGYSLIVCFALLPEDSIEYVVGRAVPSAETVSRISSTFQLGQCAQFAKNIVLWDNYQNSISAFIVLYTVYFVSSFTGLGFLLAVVAGSAVAVHLAPAAMKEKAGLEIQKQIATLRAMLPAKAAIPKPETSKESPKIAPVTSPVSQVETSPAESHPAYLEAEFGEAFDKSK